VVECAGLENRSAGNRTVGSNPTLSAIKKGSRWGALFYGEGLGFEGLRVLARSYYPMLLLCDPTRASLSPTRRDQNVTSVTFCRTRVPPSLPFIKHSPCRAFFMAKG
jgi:hypothetical protein